MSRSHHPSGAAPSQRMLRVAELIRHAMAQMLSRGDINDPVLEKHVVTVSRVKMSPDLKLATVYVMPLGGKDEPEVIAALDRHRKFLRGEIAHEVNLKFAPEIRFRIDDSFDTVSRIDAILNSERVKRDLEGAQDDSSDDAPEND
ncbi:30S ribosome-binding factor RbfA [Methylocystis echinoides]|nr:30S ribosome-binding factor RbfA [Methylocystis echinoides]